MIFLKERLILNKNLVKLSLNVVGVQGSTAGAALPGTLHPLPPSHHGLAQGTVL
jgi:hypothetical protein